MYAFSCYQLFPVISLKPQLQRHLIFPPVTQGLVSYVHSAMMLVLPGEDVSLTHPYISHSSTSTAPSSI